MPRQKKQRLKPRKDGRYAAYYKGKAFYGATSDEAIAIRDAYKNLEKIHTVERISPPLEYYANQWLKISKPNASKRTIEETKIHLKKLTNRYGCISIGDIKPSDIKTIYAECYNGLSDSYIKSAAQIYRSLFDAAVEDKYCSINPARSNAAKPHKGNKGTHRNITQEERTWIHDLCKDHRAHLAAMTMLYAGLRPQEMKAIDIDRDIDFKNMTISVTHTAHIERNNHYEITEKGKTDKANRTIPLFLPLYNALKDHHGPLITKENGEAATVTSWRTLWNSYVYSMETAINGMPKRWYGKTREHKAILASGKKLPEWKSFTVVPYDLRTSYCCMLRDNNVEMKTCCYWMGHSDAKMILSVYDEVSYERRLAEAKRLEKKLFDSKTTVKKKYKLKKSL